MSTLRDLNAEAKRLFHALKNRNLRIVFAESCTGGLVSAALTNFPGISAYHCGSAVVYRIGTKSEWLGISPEILEKPGPVSRVVAEAMAKNVLKQTPEAAIAASVTGHLGPDAPRQQDGLIYADVAVRRQLSRKKFQAVVTRKHWLSSPENAKASRGKLALRRRRQREAAEFVIKLARTVIEERFAVQGDDSIS